MTEREQFEAWWASRREGGYNEKRLAWFVWQAARAQPAQAVHEKAPEAYATGAAGSTERTSVLPDVPILAQAVPLLTDDEIDVVWDAIPQTQFWWRRYARAIEQAVRAKMGKEGA